MYAWGEATGLCGVEGLQKLQNTLWIRKVLMKQGNPRVSVCRSRSLSDGLAEEAVEKPICDYFVGDLASAQDLSGFERDHSQHNEAL